MYCELNQVQATISERLVDTPDDLSKRINSGEDENNLFKC